MVTLLATALWFVNVALLEEARVIRDREILAQLQGDEAQARAGIIRVRQLGSEARFAVRSLIHIIRTSEVNRQVAVSALGAIGSRAVVAVPDLLRLLDDEEPIVRSGVMYSIREIGPLSIPYVIPLVVNPSALKRYQGLWMLSQIDRTSAWVALLLLTSALSDPDSDVRVRALELLAGHRSHLHWVKILLTLADRDKPTKQ